MAPNLSDFCARYLRFALLLCFGFIGLGEAASAVATARVELYQATAPVADRSEAAQGKAIQAALETVLVRVTGRRTADDDPALGPLLSNARRYVQQYREAPDNQLWIAFDGPAIERWLTQNGQPLWGRERPTTFVWLTAPSGAQAGGNGAQTGGNGAQAGTIVTADDTSDLKTAIDAAALGRGIPLMWPSSADLQRAHIDSASFNGTISVLVDAAHRLGADSTLIGRSIGTAAGAAAGAGAGAGAGFNIKWTLVFQDGTSEFPGVLEGVNRAADTYAGLFAASGTLAPIDIEVSGVSDLRAYAEVQGYLESQTFISHVSVLDLSRDTVRFRLTTRGGAESLQRALALNGRLEPMAADENGLQRFILRR